jgi:hypothetical protein
VVSRGARCGWLATAAAGFCVVGCSSSSTLKSNPDSGGGDSSADSVVVDAPQDIAPEGKADVSLDLAADGTDAATDLSADRADAAEGGDGGGDGACAGGPLSACACGAACTGPCTPLCNAVPAAGVCRDPANGSCDCGGVMVDNCVKPGTRCLCPSCGDAPGALCVTDAQRTALCTGVSAAAFRCN